jgi:hypothetical protein
MKGKLTVGLLVAAGVLAAAFGWWHGYDRGQRVLALWGPAAAELIRLAPSVQLARIVPVSDGPTQANAQPSVIIGGRPWTIAARRDITQARGLTHARQALIDDPSYDWSRPGPPATAELDWRYMLSFDRRGQVCRLVFAPDPGVLLNVDTGQSAYIGPIRTGLAQFCAEHL